MLGSSPPARGVRCGLPNLRGDIHPERLAAQPRVTTFSAKSTGQHRRMLNCKSGQRRWQRR